MPQTRLPFFPENIELIHIYIGEIKKVEKYLLKKQELKQEIQGFEKEIK